MVKFRNINHKGSIMKSIYMASGGEGEQRPKKTAPPTKPKKK